MKGTSRSPSPVTSKDKLRGTASASRQRGPLKSSFSTHVKGTSVPTPRKESSRTATPRTSPAISTPSTPASDERKAEAVRLSGSSKTGRCMACSLTAVVICVVGAVILYTRMSRYLAKTEKETCDKPVCRQYTWLLSMTVNASVNPCDNFYRHVCDGWKRRNERSVREEQVKQFVKGMMSTAVALATKVPTTGQTAIQKAAVFFASCAAILTGAAKNEMSSLKKALAEAHVTWPYFPAKKYLIETMIYLGQNFDCPVGLDVVVTTVAKRTVVHVASSYLLDMMYSRRRYFIQHGNYEEYFQLFNGRLRTPGKPLITYKGQIALDEELFMPIVQAGRYAQENPETLEMTVQEFARHTPGFAAQRWHVAFRTQLDVPASLTYTIRVHELSYVKTFFNLTAQVGESKMQLFVGFAALQLLAIFANHDIVAILYGPGEERKKQYSELCSAMTNLYMGKAFIAPYLARQLEQQTKYDISDIAIRVEKTYQNIHGRNKNASLSRSLFKYVDYFLSSDLDKDFASFSDMSDDFIVNWKSATRSARRARKSRDISGTEFPDSNVTFYFIGERTNDVSLLPYAIGVPTYDYDAPLGIKYAGLGAELSMAINDVSKRSAHQDDDHHVACLKAASPEVSNTTASALLDRSIALQTAWQSFRTAESLKNRVEPGFLGLSQDELFFLFWCYNLCSSKNPETETHCNVPLKLNSDFNRVFGCRPSGPMKCS